MFQGFIVFFFQMNLFLSKLMGPPIGFTCFGILTITKELILSVRIKTLSQVGYIDSIYIVY